MPQGTTSTRVVATTHDEIGVLANTFNQMAEAMEKRAAERTQAQEALSRANSELEQRVEERTVAAGQPPSGARSRKRGRAKRLLRCFPCGYGGGGPATSIFKSQPANRGHDQGAH